MIGVGGRGVGVRWLVQKKVNVFVVMGFRMLGEVRFKKLLSSCSEPLYIHKNTYITLLYLIYKYAFIKYIYYIHQKRHLCNDFLKIAPAPTCFSQMWEEGQMRNANSEPMRGPKLTQSGKPPDGTM